MVYTEAEPTADRPNPSPDSETAVPTEQATTAERPGPADHGAGAQHDGDNDVDDRTPIETGDGPTSGWVGQRVQVNDSHAPGVVVEDFGFLPAIDVDLGDGRTVRPRRFAIDLDAGALVFCDQHQITAT